MTETAAAGSETPPAVLPTKSPKRPGAKPQASKPGGVAANTNRQDPSSSQKQPQARQKAGGSKDAPHRSATGGVDVEGDALEELQLPTEVAREMQAAWHDFVKGAGGPEAAGKLFFNVLFETVPSMQSLFTTPQAVQALHFVSGMNELVEVALHPRQLRIAVEALAFRHLNVEVQAANSALFRDRLLDVVAEQMADDLNRSAYEGLKALVNYVGEAIPHVRTHFAERLTILRDSWSVATGRTEEKGSKRGIQRGQSKEIDDSLREVNDLADLAGEQKESSNGLSQASRSWKDVLRFKSFKKNSSQKASKSHGEHGERSEHDLEQVGNNTGHRSAQEVPRTFNEMFKWNAQVMGFGNRMWLGVVLQSFDTIVVNVASPSRLQQECNVLTLKIAKITREQVNLAEFKSCMLASLRSLLPKTWDSSYENAWNWLWDNVEKQLRKNMGSPPTWERQLTNFYNSIDDSTRHRVRRRIYDRFFEVAPAGQEYFKQSDTRLHFIADRMLQMTQEIFQRPGPMVDELSALGLRHVGYNIPTELIPPFVTCCIEVFTDAADEDLTIDAFRWSLNLIASMLVGTIKEGSTAVMQAINSNSARMVHSALCKAPRGSRAMCLLKVQVGTQSISPLKWALESGSHEAAQAIFEDLLTIRADRDRYYYGMEDLFGQHPDIIEILVDNAPSLLPVFLEGLVWRSRITEEGQRRANFYVKYLLVDANGAFADALGQLVRAKDPALISHPVIILVSDCLWSGIAMREFILSKVWFVVSLAIFMMGIVVLPKTAWREDIVIRWIIFACRIANYTCTMGRLLVEHGIDCVKAYRQGKTFKACRCIPVPSYLEDTSRALALCLGLLLACMCIFEPMLRCLGENTFEDGPTEDCTEGEDNKRVFSIYCMFACAAHWFLLADLAVFSTGLSAFRLVIAQVMSEIGRFILVMVFLLTTAASAIVVLEHKYKDFSSVPWTMVGLYSITIRLYEDDFRELSSGCSEISASCLLTRDDYRELNQVSLIFSVFFFVTCSAVILLNLLIAQLNQSYNVINNNSLGFARLKRAEVIVDTVREVQSAKWDAFVANLGLDIPLEFSQGDVGFGGGFQRYEPASEHVVSSDAILRYGGARAEEMPWPQDVNEDIEDKEDTYDRIERLAALTIKRLQVAEGRKRGKNGGRDSSRSGSFHSSGASMRSAHASGSDSD